MTRFSLYRIASDRELLYITNASAIEPADAIKDAIREYPYLKPYARFVVAVPHTQVRGFAMGAIFRLPEEK